MFARFIFLTTITILSWQSQTAWIGDILGAMQETEGKKGQIDIYYYELWIPADTKW